MLAGGWSDTPPITYEHGGAVVDVAVLVDGCRPIGARVRRIAQPELRLVSLSGTPRSEVVAELVCQELEHLQDYCQPHAPGEGSPASLALYLQCPVGARMALFRANGMREQVAQPASALLFFQEPCSKLPLSAPRLCSSPHRHPYGPS